MQRRDSYLDCLFGDVDREGEVLSDPFHQPKSIRSSNAKDKAKGNGKGNGVANGT